MTRKSKTLSVAPHQFWQHVYPPGSFPENPDGGHRGLYPAVLPDGCQIALPIRILPGDGRRAVASLIVNQASFAVEDALADALADRARAFAPEMIVGVPTLGLTIAAALARRLGHTRMLPLGTSRKFWYEEKLSEPIVSITSPGHDKRVYLDPRLLPLLASTRVAVVDDVISTGTSMAAVLNLLSRAGVRPVAVLAAMLQGKTGPGRLATHAGWHGPVASAIETPLLAPSGSGGWIPAE